MQDGRPGTAAPSLSPPAGILRGFSGMKDGARAKASPIEGAVGATVPRYFSSHHRDRGWQRPLSCASQHIPSMKGRL